MKSGDVIIFKNDNVHFRPVRNGVLFRIPGTQGPGNRGGPSTLGQSIRLEEKVVKFDRHAVVFGMLAPQPPIRPNVTRTVDTILTTSTGVMN